jgi:hypothetical protein
MLDLCAPGWSGNPTSWFRSGRVGGRRTRALGAFHRPLCISLLCLLTASGAAHARTIQFAGLSWTVKSGYGGPGPNFWSDSTESVWVDAQGRLHLKIRQVEGVWCSAEVLAQQSFGYAQYTAKLSSNPELYDPNAVVGLFVYQNDTEEIDIELTKWGNASDPDTGQFAVQPSVPGTSSRVRFPTGLTGTNPPSTHHFTWSPDYIFFQSYRGHADELPSPSDLMREHTYIGSKIPPLSTATYRINFWMFQGRTPTSEMELIVDDVIITLCESDDECDDHVFCTGEEICTASGCESLGDPCAGPDQSCDEDSQACVCAPSGNVDLADFAWFAPCIQGPGVPVTPECLCADRDQDGDADLGDFASFQRAFSAAEVLFDFEGSTQNWWRFGAGTLTFGRAVGLGSTGDGIYYVTNLEPNLWGGAVKSPDLPAAGIDLSQYSGFSADVQLSTDGLSPAYPGPGPQVELMLQLPGYFEWAALFDIPPDGQYRTVASDFADLIPQSSATMPITEAQLQDPSLEIRVLLRNLNRSPGDPTGKVRLRVDTVSARP